MKTNSIAILLTATIKPNNMSNTQLQDKEKRQQQYLEAINYYLNKTDLKLIFCENSGFDIYDNIINSEKKERLEYLTFKGNIFDYSLGKGYGEFQIIQYALKNSVFIKECDYILKITGRLKIINIDKIIKRFNSISGGNNFFIEFTFQNFINTVCFIIPSKQLEKIFIKRKNIINENKQYYIENFLYDNLLLVNKINLFEIHPFIEGISGTLNIPYNKLTEYSNNLYLRKYRHELYYCSFLKEKREKIDFIMHKLKSFFYKILCVLKIKYDHLQIFIY